MSGGPTARVVVVDDEPVLAGMVKNYLERAGMETRTCSDGLQAVELVREWRPDVVVLDLGLPGLDGMEVCRQVRTFSECYVVMLTARADEVDTLLGLSVGADDYVTKPFSPRELVARIQVMLRRPRAARDQATLSERRFGDLLVRPEAREVLVADVPVELTRTEFDLLDAISANPGRVLSRRQLTDEVWGKDWRGDDHLVDVHIAHLRKKLGDDPSAPRFVVTVRGVGYRMGSGR